MYVFPNTVREIKLSPIFEKIHAWIKNRLRSTKHKTEECQQTLNLHPTPPKQSIFESKPETIIIPQTWHQIAFFLKKLSRFPAQFPNAARQNRRENVFRRPFSRSVNLKECSFLAIFALDRIWQHDEMDRIPPSRDAPLPGLRGREGYLRLYRLLMLGGITFLLVNRWISDIMRPIMAGLLTLRKA